MRSSALDEQGPLDHIDNFTLAPFDHGGLEEIVVPEPPDHRRGGEESDRD